MRGFGVNSIPQSSLFLVAVGVFLWQEQRFVVINPTIGSPCSYTYASFVPHRDGHRWTPQPGIRSENTSVYYVSDWVACPRAADEPGFKRICNEKHSCKSALPPGASVYDDLPYETVWGESVKSVIQRTLQAAWGPDPPQIDLYLRAGCGATTEIAYLLPTIELFWPEFIGEVIIALDAGNNASLEHFLPLNWRSTQQSYRFVYEDVPCLPGRIFNQVSYLNMDMHSQAKYILSLDSDCALHSPVTPDLIFDEKGRVLLAHSKLFQTGMWDGAVEYFTGNNTFISHTMVTQPIVFVRETLAAYRDWHKRVKGDCYYDSVSRFYSENHGLVKGTFCWMCQLDTFIRFTGITEDAYHFVDLDDVISATTYQRYGIHTSYEGPDLSFEMKSRRVVLEGLCRVFQENMADCYNVDDDSINYATFSYAFFNWQQISKVKSSHLNDWSERFQNTEYCSRPQV